MANLFVVGAIATTVFLGGWQIPASTSRRTRATGDGSSSASRSFFAKAMTMVFVIIWIRWTLPRSRRPDDEPLLEVLRPLDLRRVLFQALWVWLAPPTARSVMAAFTTVVCGGGLLWVFFSRSSTTGSRTPRIQLEAVLLGARGRKRPRRAERASGSGIRR